MLKLYVRYWMIADKVHEVISFIQQVWLKYDLLFNTIKEVRAGNEL